MVGPAGSTTARHTSTERVTIMTTKTEKTTADVAKAEPIFDLSGVNSLDEAMAVIAQQGGTVEQITEYGEGFILLPTEEKSSLLKVPFLIVDGSVRTDKETERDYFSFRIVTQDGRKLVVNDGSVGLMQQALRIIERRGTVAGLVVLGGLTGGEYTTTIEGPKGPEKIKASTYYFAGV